MTDNKLQKKIAELEAQIRKLKKSNLGLVFEDKPEDVVEQCQNQVPVLKEVVKNRINLSNGFTNNLLIEGDNYHSLSVLNYTHKSKIDLIYIDPPYNTGNNDFIYNDQYVDTEDSYRHSKWLSFMRNRLILARELLKDDGAIFISIDDNEQAHLRILCDKIFGERNFVANIIWQHSVQPKGYTGTFSLHHNHILCYRKSEKFGLNTLERTDEHNKNYSNPDNDPRGPWRSGDVRNALYRPNLIFDIKTPSGKTIKPPQNGWRWSKETIKEKIKTGEIIFSEDETRIIRKIYLDTLEGRTPETIWFGKDVGTTREAQQELKKLFQGEIKFETPKPTKLIKQILKLHKGDNVVVLDFFAGSGTTGHAVLNLNTEDGGKRKFILCTNNEDNNGSGKKIATDICYPRIKKVIKGYNDANGIPSNLFYYQTDLVDIGQIHKVPDDAKIRITYQAGEMIAVREDALNEVEKNDWWQIFEGKDKLTAIYFKEDKAKLGKLIEKLEKKNQPVALYIFSWGKNEYKGEYSTVNIRVEDIPEPIIEVYKELNRI